MEHMEHHRTSGGETITQGCLPDYRSAWNLPEEIIKSFDDGNHDLVRKELARIEPIITYDGYINERYAANERQRIEEKRKRFEKTMEGAAPEQRKSGEILLSQIQSPLGPSAILENTDPEKRRKLNEFAYNFNAELLAIKHNENLRDAIDRIRYFVDEIEKIIPKNPTAGHPFEYEKKK